MKSNQQEGYKIPENYFNSSREVTVKSLHSLESKSTSTHTEKAKWSSRRLFPILGIAASLALIVGVFSLNDNSLESSLDEVNETELLAYLEAHIDDYTIDELSDINEHELDTSTEFEDTDYLDYLEEVDIDELYDLM